MAPLKKRPNKSKPLGKPERSFVGCTIPVEMHERLMKLVGDADPRTTKSAVIEAAIGKHLDAEGY